MIRRYDMSKSDNFPVTANYQYACSGSGELIVYTGFPVKSATITPIGLHSDARLYVDMNGFGKNGFKVLYEDVPESEGGVEFSYMAI